MTRKLILYFTILSFIHCGQEKTADIKAKEEKKEKQKQEIPKPTINYHLIPLDSPTITWLRSMTNGDSMKLILVLNRIDKRYLYTQDSLVVPDTFITDLKIYAPFPEQMEILKEVHKIIIFSYYTQAFAVYENGKLIRWGPVSMGSFYTQTPPGLYHANWKSKVAISREHPDWLMKWFFNLDNYEGVSMHEYDMPGFPASHACIRLYAEDAKWLYKWTDQWICPSNTQIDAYGTPVIVYGSYPFFKRRPWRKLADNNKAMIITEQALTTETKNFLPLIMERQATRDSVILARDTLYITTKRQNLKTGK